MKPQTSFDRSVNIIVHLRTQNDVMLRINDVIPCGVNEVALRANFRYGIQEDAVPAWWNPKDRSFAYSFFGTEEEALTMLMQEVEYKLYFDKL